MPKKVISAKFTAPIAVVPTLWKITSSGKHNGHAKPLQYQGNLTKPGLLRVGHLLQLLSISHSGLYSRMAAGTVPKPDGKDGKRPYWYTSTIAPLVGVQQ